jgi:hypothetical protein
VEDALSVAAPATMSAAAPRRNRVSESMGIINL